MDIKQRILERTTKELPLLVDYEDLEGEFDFIVKKEVKSLFSIALTLGGHKPEYYYIVSPAKVIAWANANNLFAELSHEKPNAIVFYKQHDNKRSI